MFAGSPCSQAKSAYHQMVLYCKTEYLNHISQQLSEDYYTIGTHHHASRFSRSPSVLVLCPLAGYLEGRLGCPSFFCVLFRQASGGRGSIHHARVRGEPRWG